MKTTIRFALVLLVIGLMSCETTIHPDLNIDQPIYVIDAFVTSKREAQVIHITQSQNYFTAATPPGVKGAQVVIRQKDGTEFHFDEDHTIAGDYVWVPSGNEFDVLGSAYTLSVTIKDETFVAEAKLNRVPPIDSLNLQLGDRTTDGTKFYRAQFWATDPAGPGDTYWIKAYKNGVLLNKPSEINIAYDGAFSKGAGFDGFVFIQPIRTLINPDDKDANGKALPPFASGDSLYVEIHSLTEASFDYINQVILQTNRPGGFGELFASPIANVSTNLSNTNPGGSPVAGFFNVASVSGRGRKFIY